MNQIIKISYLGTKSGTRAYNGVAQVTIDGVHQSIKLVIDIFNHTIKTKEIKGIRGKLESYAAELNWNI